MKQSLLILLAASLLLLGCHQDPLPLDPNNPIDPVDTTKTISQLIKQRDPSFPLSARTGIIAATGDTLVSGVNGVDFDDVLCRTFRIDKYPFADIKNVGYHILDVERFDQDHSPYADKMRINSSEQYSKSFSSLDRFGKANRYNDLFAGHDEFNLFNLRLKEAYREMLNLSESQFNTAAVGELALRFQSLRYRVLLMEPEIKRIREGYLLKAFTDDLYNNSMHNLLKSYGECMLTQFSTGAQTIGLYSGNFTGEDPDDSEFNFYSEIESTLGRLSGDGSLTVGRNAHENVSKTGMFSDISFTLRTYGGAPSFPEFTAPCAVNEAVLDITDWNKSLSDESKYVFISISDNSLIPLSYFVEEYNIKTMINNIYKLGYSNVPKDMFEPHIEILVDESSAKTSVQTSLVTRYGEKLVFNQDTLSSTVENQVAKEVERMGNLFAGLRIVSVTTNSPTVKQGVNAYDGIKFEKSRMTKYVDPESKKIYIFTEDTLMDKKIAYTLYDKSVVDEYIFKEFVEGLTELASADDRKFRSCYLIAL